MKNKQTVKMAAAVAVLFVAVGGYFGIRQWNQSLSEKENEDTSLPVVSVNAEDIEKFSYVYNGETISFVKEDGIWYYDADREFPVKQTTIEGKLDSVVSTEGSRELEADDDMISQYGLDEPANTIILEDKDGSEHVLEIGDVNDSTGEYYCRKDRGSKVYMISSSLNTMMSFDIYSAADMDSFPAFSSNQIRKVSVDDGTNVTDYNSEDNSEMYTTAAGLYYTSHVDYNCTDLSQYGLEDPQYVITIKYAAETEEETGSDTDETESGVVGTADSSETAEESAADETQTPETEEEIVETIVLNVGNATDTGYYVQVEGSSQVHLMLSTLLNTLLGIEES